MTSQRKTKPSIIVMKRLDTKALRVLAEEPEAPTSDIPVVAPGAPAIVKGKPPPRGTRGWRSRLGVLAAGVVIGLAGAQVASQQAPTPVAGAGAGAAMATAAPTLSAQMAAAPRADAPKSDAMVTVAPAAAAAAIAPVANAPSAAPHRHHHARTPKTSAKGGQGSSEGSGGPPKAGDA